MKYKRVAEIARELGLSKTKLRYWQNILSLRVPVTVGRHRYYGPKQVRQYRRAVKLRAQGYTLDGIRRKLKERKAK